MYYYSSVFGIDTLREEPIELGLGGCTVAEIKALIDRLSLPLKKSGRKQALIDAITEYITLFPDHVVKHLPAAEVEILRRLIRGEEVYGNVCVCWDMYATVRLGMVGMIEAAKERETVQMVLLDEAKKLLEPVLNAYEVSRGARIADVIRGAGALLGIASARSVLKVLRTQNEYRNVTLDEVLEVMDNFFGSANLMWHPVFNDGKGDWVYLTELCPAICARINLTIESKTIAGEPRECLHWNPAEFSFQEILEAAPTLFAPVTPNRSETRNVIKVCREMKLSELQINELLFDAWREKQKMKDGIGFGKIFEKIPFESIESVNKMMGVLTDYVNTVPYWNFLGHSSHEVTIEDARRNPAPPRIVPGPNMRAMGMDIPAGLQEKIDEMWEEGIPTQNIFQNAMDGFFSNQPENADSKVGRNDPCPCGSGKKYKHCCGR